MLWWLDFFCPFLVIHFIETWSEWLSMCVCVCPIEGKRRGYLTITKGWDPLREGYNNNVTLQQQQQQTRRLVPSHWLTKAHRLYHNFVVVVAPPFPSSAYRKSARTLCNTHSKFTKKLSLNCNKDFLFHFQFLLPQLYSSSFISLREGDINAHTLLLIPCFFSCTQCSMNEFECAKGTGFMEGENGNDLHYLTYLYLMRAIGLMRTSTKTRVTTISKTTTVVRNPKFKHERIICVQSLHTTITWQTFPWNKLTCPCYFQEQQQ